MCSVAALLALLPLCNSLFVDKPLTLSNRVYRDKTLVIGRAGTLEVVDIPFFFVEYFESYGQLVLKSTEDFRFNGVAAWGGVSVRSSHAIVNHGSLNIDYRVGGMKMMFEMWSSTLWENTGTLFIQGSGFGGKPRTSEPSEHYYKSGSKGLSPDPNLERSSTEKEGKVKEADTDKDDDDRAKIGESDTDLISSGGAEYIVLPMPSSREGSISSSKGSSGDAEDLDQFRRLKTNEEYDYLDDIESDEGIGGEQGSQHGEPLESEKLAISGLSNKDDHELHVKKREDTDAEEVDVLIRATHQLLNNGIVTIAGTPDLPFVTSFEISRRGADAKDFTNHGSICIAHGFWDINVAMIGRGCIAASENSKIVVRPSLSKSGFILQSFFLNPLSGTASILVKEASGLSRPFLSIFGLRPGAFIRFDRPKGRFEYKNEKITLFDEYLTPLEITIGGGYEILGFVLDETSLTYVLPMASVTVPGCCRCGGNYGPAESSLEGGLPTSSRYALGR